MKNLMAAATAGLVGIGALGLVIAFGSFQPMTDLSECEAQPIENAQRPQENPYRTAATRYVQLHNNFDAARSKAFIPNERPANIKKAVDWERSVVGLCSTVSPLITGKSFQRWKAHCQKGYIHMNLVADADGRMTLVRAVALLLDVVGALVHARP